MRTRHRELMWTALPISTAFSDPYLLIYTEKSVDIYDVPSSTWLQSLPLSRTRSLTSDGCICLSHDPELLNHHPKLLYLKVTIKPLILYLQIFGLWAFQGDWHILWFIRWASQIKKLMRSSLTVRCSSAKLPFMKIVLLMTARKL